MLMRLFNKAILKIYQNKSLRKIFLPFQENRPDKKYVFIVGCYNSGTTLLNHIISSHPEVSSLPTEGAVLTSGLTRPEEFGWPRMWHMCADKVRFDENSPGPDPVRIKKDWSFWYDKNKDIYLEKSIANSTKIKWIEKHFNNPHFIWIVRNGYCTAEGIRRRSMNINKHELKYKNTGYPIDMCAKQWLVNNSVIENDSKSVKNLIMIHYEDLMEDLQSTLEKIFEWLPVNNKDIKTDKFKEFRFHKQTKPIKNMNPESFQRLNEDDIKNINEVAQHYMEYLGYKVL